MTFNGTRWSTIGETLKRYHQLQHILKDQFASESSMLDLLISPKEENEVNNLKEKMVILSSVTVALQRN